MELTASRRFTPALHEFNPSVRFSRSFAPRWMERIMIGVQDHIVPTLLAVIVLSAISIFAAFASQ
jgi:hypothetical protein